VVSSPSTGAAEPAGDAGFFAAVLRAVVVFVAEVFGAAVFGAAVLAAAALVDAALVDAALVGAVFVDAGVDSVVVARAAMGPSSRVLRALRSAGITKTHVKSRGVRCLAKRLSYPGV